RLLEIERVVELGREPSGGIVDLFLEIGHLGFAQRFLELALKLGRHAPDFGGPLPDRAQHRRQLLRPDDNQRHHGDNDKLSPCNVEHCISPPKAAAAVGRPYQRELRAAKPRRTVEGSALSSVGVSRTRLPPGAWRRRPMNQRSGDPASSPVRSYRARSSVSRSWRCRLPTCPF